MKKILVPTDFSELSKPSVHYAAMLANKLESEVVLLHVIDISNSETMLKRSRLEEEVVELAKEDAETLIQELRADYGPSLTISFDYRMGHPLHKTLENFVNQNGIGLIVMGTHGATGIRKLVMGSNASSVINNSSIPVIAVPPDAALKLKKIFYATDMSNLLQELNLLTGFAAVFNASIHVVHVASVEAGQNIGREKIKEQLRSINYPRIYFHVLKGDEVASVIDAFVKKSNAHMLAMFTHKLDFFEKLFGKSITHELASQNHIPLLTFNKTKLGDIRFF